VWPDTTTTLEQAQANKARAGARKLGLAPGCGCSTIWVGWGGMVLHAAKEHGVRAVGSAVEAAAYLSSQLAPKLGVATS